ncbi:unnamed protein product [Durusdinium trenchii]|uniref:proton-translocating NAD(P)(+) transhydrogenase n=1 Tax=Durusdinium trenchii TaxID=1381693 RepID=A0ABP0S8A9_9DINO
MLWEIEITPAEGSVDREGISALAECKLRNLSSIRSVRSARSYLIEGTLDESAVRQAADLLSDDVVEERVLRRLPHETDPEQQGEHLLNVLYKPGVTDNVGLTASRALQNLNIPSEQVATCRKYWVNADASEDEVARFASRVLSNDSIERVLDGPLTLTSLAVGSDYQFELQHVSIREMDDDALMRLSKEGQLYLSLPEMQTIRSKFQELDRDPTDIELETIAQTWSEHCSHKTLAGRIAYRDENGEKRFENMLKETVFAATQEIRKLLGENDWCVSVFKDNAGIVTFDDEQDVCIKVETHNHPSALEPYGGANTGLGGVIRDPLGTGMGARPVCNTDVFCFAPPDTPFDSLPPGVLHPRTVMHGVVAGVRDYGNRMGIPTVNGAVFFDERYLGNPLVYCGNIAMIPRGMSEKEVIPGDYIVAVGGRTGRDGIHGATFSSAELTHESEELSGGAVQIGNPITEKMVHDVILDARDQGLFNAITDCGAGGFSSAVGEMGEETGAEVWLEKAPLKYSGLSYTEIWISEAQERMVLAVPEEKWQAFNDLCASEGVEACILGKFTDSKELVLKYEGEVVGHLPMSFLHDGRPPVVREATYQPQPETPTNLSSIEFSHGEVLKQIMASLNVCSKESIIRQYDHEVQAGSVVKPLVGIKNDGPSDAAVVRPDLRKPRGGLAVALAEMAFAGGLGVDVKLDSEGEAATVALFSESNTRYVIEVEPDQLDAVQQAFAKNGAIAPTQLGTVTSTGQAYVDAGATLVDDRNSLIQSSDVLLQVRAAVANPTTGDQDLDQLKEGQTLIAQCDPLSDTGKMQELAGKKLNIFALELVPRTTRAQSMDVLSSMATIAGYKAVLLAANHSPQMFPMMMTAAGTLTPARVFVLGAGVAGLQAIATAKRLGAVVSAYDVRSAVKEQVESLGGKFVEMDLDTAEGQGGYAREMDEEFYRKQRELMLKVIADSDVIITTAAIPGKKAPILVTKEMVEAMPAGGVIVDLAAERGGNCELTKSGETIEVHDVTILGPENVPSDIPRHASQMYSNNITTFLKLLIKDGEVNLDLEDDIIAGTLVTHQGEMIHPLCRKIAGLPELAAPSEESAAADESVVSFIWIIIGVLIGAGIGVYFAVTIKMERMPEMVALFNGFGGAASVFVAGGDLWLRRANESFISTDMIISVALAGIIGAVTLTGSLVAFAKLAELSFVKKLKPLPSQQIINAALALVVLLLTVVLVNNPGSGWYWLIVFVAFGLGYLLTISIGGADMPVVIALLNSYSGLAAAATGFVLQNNVLIISGSLVGASGLILTKVMCDAMNRSLPAVLFGSLGPAADGPSADEVYTNVKSTSAEEVAMLMEVASSVVIVPGYGMAVAQAQHAVRDLTNLLRDQGIKVTFGIHPVAGRMPGHMNVLLAEADIPYDLLKEMDETNSEIEQTDVCLVIGANDTVNPDARTNPNSPIAGMPIINADKAKTCIIIKRSLSPGFAGIPNPLFSADNALMLFADGKQAVTDIITAIKEG